MDVQSPGPKHGYRRMPLAKSSGDATAMSTPLGFMRWKVMPMWVKNGNAEFQRMKEDLLRALDCADPFLDDIGVSSGTPEMTEEALIQAYFVDLCKVLEVERKHKLTCNAQRRSSLPRNWSSCDRSWATESAAPCQRSWRPSPTGNGPRTSLR